MTREATHDPIAPILERARLIVCCGPGGVGKTTTAAALGLRGALMGRKVIVLTIDPARRLANSLGLEELSNEPQRIELAEEVARNATGSGELWAMMLDQKQTLDDLVRKNAPDPGAFERAQNNNIYRLLSSTLHGMQEYMALDKLHDLYTGGYFDLVVLDTPPTKNALEFLETPSRARTFFDERIIKWFIPSRQKSKGLFGRMFDAGGVVTKVLSTIFGETFVKELVEFFETLEFLQQALHQRGDMIDFILRDLQTHFFIITSADPRRIKEALFFHEKLGEMSKRAEAFVINRVIPEYMLEDLSALTDEDLLARLDPAQADQAQGLRAQLERSYAELKRLAERDKESLTRLASKVGDGPLRRVPLLGEDVHSIEQLLALSNFLTPSQPIEGIA